MFLPPARPVPFRVARHSAPPPLAVQLFCVQCTVERCIHPRTSRIRSERRDDELLGWRGNLLPAHAILWNQERNMK